MNKRSQEGNYSRQRLHQLKYPERHHARKAVSDAVKRGVLQSPSSLPCAECGQPAKEYDHYKGYEKEHWLDVQPVCTDCHNKRPRSPRVKGRTIQTLYNAGDVRSLPGLKRVRESYPLTQQELADKSGVGRVSIARLELGQTEARPSTTRALAKALGVHPSVLMAVGGDQDG